MMVFKDEAEVQRACDAEWERLSKEYPDQNHRRDTAYWAFTARVTSEASILNDRTHEFLAGRDERWEQFRDSQDDDEVWHDPTSMEDCWRYQGQEAWQALTGLDGDTAPYTSCGDPHSHATQTPRETSMNHHELFNAVALKRAARGVFGYMSMFEQDWEAGVRPALDPTSGDILFLTKHGSYVRARRDERLHTPKAFDTLHSMLTERGMMAVHRDMVSGYEGWSLPEAAA